MEESWPFFQVPQNFKDLQRAHRRKQTGRFWNFKAGTNVRLASQVINMIRLCLQKDASNGGRVFQVRVMQKKPSFVDFRIMKKVVQSCPCCCTASTDQSVNGMAFPKQQLSKIAAILARDTGDERG